MPKANHAKVLCIRYKNRVKNGGSAMKALSKINFCCLLLMLMVGCGAAETTATVEPVKTMETEAAEAAMKAAPETSAEEEPGQEKSAGDTITTAEKEQLQSRQQAVEKVQADPERQTSDEKQAAKEVLTAQKQLAKDKPQTTVEQEVVNKQQAVKQQQKADEKTTEQKQQSTDPNQAAAIEPSEEEQQAQPEEEEDENRVLASVNGKELRAWEADFLLKNELAFDRLGVVNTWIKIMAKSAEVRRLGLDKTREVEYELKFMKDFHFATAIFTKKMQDDIPELTDEELREYYELNISQYVRPLSADLQHISVLQKDLAAEIAAEAQKPEVSFDKLVEKYGSEKVKTTQGRLYGASVEYLEDKLGPRVAEAVSKSRPREVLGPIMGREGFVVIKVHKVLLPKNITFEQAKEGLKIRLDADRYQEAMENIEEELLAKVKVVKSEEILKLEKQKEEVQKQPPGRVKPPMINK